MTAYRSRSRSRSRSNSPIERGREYRSPPPLNPNGPRGDRDYPPRDDYRDRDVHYSSSRGGGRGRRYSRSRSRSRSPYYGGRGRDHYGGSHHYRRSPPPPYGRGSRRRAPRNFHGSEEDRARSTVLYLGNIPYFWAEPEIRRWMKEKCGDPKVASVSVPMEYREKNRGFAFVDFGERQEAEKIYQMHTDGLLEAEGRKIRIDWDVSPRASSNYHQ
jgi:hypothetical protein